MAVVWHRLLNSHEGGPWDKMSLATLLTCPQKTLFGHRSHASLVDEAWQSRKTDTLSEMETNAHSPGRQRALMVDAVAGNEGVETLTLRTIGRLTVSPETSHNKIRQ